MWATPAWKPSEFTYPTELLICLPCVMTTPIILDITLHFIYIQFTYADWNAYVHADFNFQK